MPSLSKPALAVALTAALASAGLAGASGVGATNATSPACDIQNDGAEDIIIAAPKEDIGSHDDTGNIWVIPAANAANAADPTTLDLIDPTAAKAFNQGTPGVPGSNEDNDFWGSALACGDFNNDGFGDVAVGAELEDLGSKEDAGNVTILFGSASGLTTAGAQTINQGTAGVKGISEPGDLFGHSLAVGDFNGDGIDDLVIGAPGEGIGTRDDAGAVWIIPGSNNGLDTGDDQVISQSSVGVVGASEIGDGFGFEVAVGDIDGDQRDDLVVSAPGEDTGSTVDAGAIWVFPGTASGINGTNEVAISQAGSVVGASEAEDFFGSALSVFDITGDGLDDVFVGAFGEDVGSLEDAGAIWMFEGGAISTLRNRDHIIAETATEATASFGASLTPYTNADGDLALLAGAPGHDRIDGQTGFIDHGIVRGVEWSGTRLVHGESFDGEIEFGDGGELVGDVVNSGDHNGDGRLDYVIAAPGWSFDRGAVLVFNADHDQIRIDQDTPGVPGVGENGDEFGFDVG